MMTSLGAYVAYWGTRRAEHDAVVFEEQRLDWATFAQQVEAIAAALQGQGVHAGDRVGILLPNCIEWPVVYLAIWRAGAIVVPLNVRFGAFELRGIEEDAECGLVVTTIEAGAALADRFAVGDASGIVLAPRIGTDRDPLRYADAIAVAGRPMPIEQDGDAIAAIFYTSGTTGLPKGVIHSHAGIQSCLLSLMMASGFSSADRGLLVAPLAFTGMALCTLVPILLTGGCAVIERDLVPQRVVDLIRRERITYLMVVPAIWERIAALPGFETLDLSNFRLAGTGGAPIPPSLLATYAARGLVIRQTYGSTEGGGIISIPTPDRALAEPTACGPTLPSLEARVVDATGEDVVPGTVGELMLRGAQLMRGYWRNPEATARAFDRGWYRSGDLGRMDEDGAITILDRKKNMIISGGVNIYPAEIERALASLDCVDEVAVFGVADERWGERAVAIVFPTCPVTIETIYAEARSLLGAMKAPRDIVIVGERLPRTVTNKVARTELPAIYEAARAGVNVDAE